MSIRSAKPEKWADPAHKLFPHQVGFTAPPMDFDAAPTDLVRICPDTVGVHGRLLHAPGYRHELSQRADTFHLLDEVAECLSNGGADVIGQVGTNWVHANGTDVAEQVGRIPPVMSSADLLDDPEGTDRAYCSAVGIEFDPNVLSWDPGDRSEVSWYGEGSGPWHDTLRASSGIAPPTTTYPPLEGDPRLWEMYERALPLYEELSEHRFDPMSENVRSDR